jgi:hypothetical protein
MKDANVMKAKCNLLVHSLALILVALGEPVGAAEEKEEAVPTLDGTWRWTFTMPDGTTSRPKLTLTTAHGGLSGTNSFRPGTETPITNAVLNGQDLRFQVIREREGQEIVTTYSGKWSGKTIKGKIESNWAGETQSYDWEAQRAHNGIEGTWKWPVTFDTRKFDARVDLEQDGETLTGTMPGFGRRRKIEIKNGSIKNGEVYFETERGAEEDKVVTIYKGKQTGDTIKGTIETTVDGEERKNAWEAKRVD